MRPAVTDCLWVTQGRILGVGGYRDRLLDHPIPQALPKSRWLLTALLTPPPSSQWLPRAAGGACVGTQPLLANG